MSAVGNEIMSAARINGNSGLSIIINWLEPVASTAGGSVGAVDGSPGFIPPHSSTSSSVHLPCYPSELATSVRTWSGPLAIVWVLPSAPRLLGYHQLGDSTDTASVEAIGRRLLQKAS